MYKICIVIVFFCVQSIVAQQKIENKIIENQKDTLVLQTIKDNRSLFSKSAMGKDRPYIISENISENKTRRKTPIREHVS